jgi:hypothetical protein
MSWHEERRSDIESNLQKILELLREYEHNLILEDDPGKSSAIRDKIAGLKVKMNECQNDLDSLEKTKQPERDLALKMTNINYDDMNFVIAALLRQTIDIIDNQSIVPPTNPKEKMSKNGLTSNIAFLLRCGMASAGEVRHLIENNAKINFPDVPEKLRATLNAEYIRLRKAGIYGDDLFKHLHEFSSCKSSDASWRAAGLAILCYFFESCDVFEP